jgi:soluble lytic murein transglycosylase-like protein/2'-5' RNA ligase
MALSDWLDGLLGQETEEERQRRLFAPPPDLAAPAAPAPAPLPTVTPPAAPAIDLSPTQAPSQRRQQAQADDATWGSIMAQAGQADDTTAPGPRLWDGSLDAPAPAAQPQAPSSPAPTDGPPTQVATDVAARIEKARAYARQYGIDQDLFVRQIWRESKFDPTAVNARSGAAGIAQFMPETARGLGVNPLDEDSALDGAARYMRANLDASNGDYRRALAAYNWGPGNVKGWDGADEGLPAETRTYLHDIMGGGEGGTPRLDQSAQAQAGPRAGNLTPDQHQMALDEGLDEQTAWAVCGPAAAIAFARRTGQQPTMRQALALAMQVGWTQERGMAGPASQVDLLKKMGIAAHLEDGTPDWAKVEADVGRGNPVIINTAGHYFVAEGYDPQTGKLDLGRSAMILKAAQGRRWFSPDEIADLGMGDPRAALYLDNPGSAAPSAVAGRDPGYGTANLMSRVPTLLDHAVSSAQDALDLSRQALARSLDTLGSFGTRALGAASDFGAGLRPSDRAGDPDAVNPAQRFGVDPTRMPWEDAPLFPLARDFANKFAGGVAGMLQNFESYAEGLSRVAGAGDVKVPRLVWGPNGYRLDTSQGLADQFHDEAAYFGDYVKSHPDLEPHLDFGDPRTYVDPKTYSSAFGSAAPSILAAMATGGAVGAVLGEGIASFGIGVGRFQLATAGDLISSLLVNLPTAGGQAYADLKELGKSDLEAFIGANISGALQAIPEAVGSPVEFSAGRLGALFDKATPAGQGFLRRLAGLAGTLATHVGKESFEEGSQQFIDNAVQKWFGSPKGWFDQVPENAIMGGLAALPMAAPHVTHAVLGTPAGRQLTEQDRAILDRTSALLDHLANLGTARQSPATIPAGEPSAPGATAGHAAPGTGGGEALDRMMAEARAAQAANPQRQSRLAGEARAAVDEEAAVTVHRDGQAVTDNGERAGLRRDRAVAQLEGSLTGLSDEGLQRLAAYERGLGGEGAPASREAIGREVERRSRGAGGATVLEAPLRERGITPEVRGQVRDRLGELERRISAIADAIDSDQEAYDAWRTAPATTRDTAARFDEAFAREVAWQREPEERAQQQQRLIDRINGGLLGRWYDSLGEREQEVRNRITTFETLSQARRQLLSRATESGLNTAIDGMRMPPDQADPTPSPERLGRLRGAIKGLRGQRSAIQNLVSRTAIQRAREHPDIEAIRRGRHLRDLSVADLDALDERERELSSGMIDGGLASQLQLGDLSEDLVNRPEDYSYHPDDGEPLGTTLHRDLLQRLQRPGSSLQQVMDEMTADIAERIRQLQPLQDRIDRARHGTHARPRLPESHGVPAPTAAEPFGSAEDAIAQAAIQQSNVDEYVEALRQEGLSEEDLKAERTGLIQTFGRRFLGRLFGDGTEGQFQVDVDVDSLHAPDGDPSEQAYRDRVRSAVEQGVAFIQAITREFPVTPGSRVRVSYRTSSLDSGRGDLRGTYFTADNWFPSGTDPRTGMVHLGGYEGPRTVAHELGHFLEYASPEAARAIDAYRRAREGSQAQRPVALSELLAFSGYDPSEVASEDHYIHPYIGKHYAVMGASEFLSMGIEMLMEDPVALALGDPGMFAAVVHLLKGDFDAVHDLARRTSSNGGSLSLGNVEPGAAEQARAALAPARPIGVGSESRSEPGATGGPGVRSETADAGTGAGDGGPERGLLAEPKYPFSSAQINLDEDTAGRVRALGDRIDAADLAEQGRERDPHVTVKYGLRDHETSAVHDVARGTGPVSLRFGRTSVFPDDGRRGADVVKVDVEGPRLRMLNDRLSQLPNGDTHPSYSPHATVAYVKPGRGAKYAGLADMEGHLASVDRLHFSDRNGEQREIPLSDSATEDPESIDKIRNGSTGEVANLTKAGAVTDPRFRSGSESSAAAWRDENPRRGPRIAGADGSVREVEILGQRDLEAVDPELGAAIDRMAKDVDMAPLAKALNDIVPAVAEIARGLVGADGRPLLQPNQQARLIGLMLGAVELLGSSRQGGGGRVIGVTINPHEIMHAMLASFAEQQQRGINLPEHEVGSRAFAIAYANELLAVVVHEVLHLRYNRRTSGESHPAAHDVDIKQVRDALLENQAVDRFQGLIERALSGGYAQKLDDDAATLREGVARAIERQRSPGGQAVTDQGSTESSSEPGGPDQSAGVQPVVPGRTGLSGDLSVDQGDQSDNAADPGDAAGPAVQPAQPTRRGRAGGLTPAQVDEAAAALSALVEGDAEGAVDELNQILDRGFARDQPRAIVLAAAMLTHENWDGLSLDDRLAAYAEHREALVNAAPDLAERVPPAEQAIKPARDTGVRNNRSDSVPARYLARRDNKRRLAALLAKAAARPDHATWWGPVAGTTRGHFADGSTVSIEDQAEAARLLLAERPDLAPDARIEVRRHPDGDDRVRITFGEAERAGPQPRRSESDELLIDGIGRYLENLQPGDKRWRERVLDGLREIIDDRRAADRPLSAEDEQAIGELLGLDPTQADNALLSVARQVIGNQAHLTGELPVIARFLKQALAVRIAEIRTEARGYQQQVKAGTLTRKQAEAMVDALTRGDDMQLLVGATKTLGTAFGRGLNMLRQATEIQLAQQTLENASELRADLELARVGLEKLMASERAATPRERELSAEVARLQADLDTWRERDGAAREQHAAEIERIRREYAGVLDEATDVNDLLRTRLEAAQAELEELRGRRFGTPGQAISSGEERHLLAMLPALLERVGRNMEGIGDLAGFNFGLDPNSDRRRPLSYEALQAMSDQAEAGRLLLERLLQQRFRSQPTRAARNASDARSRLRRRAALEGQGDLESVERMTPEDMVAAVAAGRTPTMRELLGDLAEQERRADRLPAAAKATEKARLKTARDSVIAAFRTELIRRMTVDRRNTTRRQRAMSVAELEIEVNHLIGSYDAQAAKHLAVLLANDGTPETRAEAIVRQVRDDHRNIVADERAALSYWIAKAAEIERAFGASDPAMVARLVTRIDDAIDELADHAAISGGEKAAEALMRKWMAARYGNGVGLVDLIIRHRVGDPVGGNHPTTTQRQAVDADHFRRFYGRLVTAVLAEPTDQVARDDLDKALTASLRTANPLERAVAEDIRRTVEMEDLKNLARHWIREAEKDPLDVAVRRLAEAAIGGVRSLQADKTTPPWQHQRWAELAGGLRLQLERALERGNRQIIDALLRDRQNAYKREALPMVRALVKDPEDPDARGQLDDLLDRMRADGHVKAADAIDRVLNIRTNDEAAQVLAVGSDLTRPPGDVRAAVANLNARVAELQKLLLRDRTGHVGALLEELYTQLRAMGDHGWRAEEQARQRVVAAGLERMGRRLGQLGGQDYARFMLTLDPTDARSVARAMRFISHPTLVQYLRELGVINLLSSPETWGPLGTNAVSQLLNNALMAVRWLPEYVGDLANYAYQTRVRGRQAARSRFASELGAGVHGLTDGGFASLWTGLVDAGWIMATGHSTTEVQRAIRSGDARMIRTEYITQRGEHWYSPWTVVGTVMHLVSTRPLSAIDAIFSSINYAVQLQMVAERKARMLGVDRRQILNHLTDHVDVVQQAGHLTDYALQQQKSTVLRGMIQRVMETLQSGDPNQSAFNQFLEIGWNALVAFTTVPWNTTKQGVDYSVVGAAVNTGRALSGTLGGAGSHDEAVAREASERNVDEALIRARGTNETHRRAFERAGETAGLYGRAAIGVLLFMAALGLAWGGYVTGDLPEDDAERARWEREGIKPRSIWIPRLGWRSYDSTPVAIPFALVANTVSNTSGYYADLRKGGFDAGPGTMVAAGGIAATTGALSAISHNFFLQNLVDLANMPSSFMREGLAGVARDALGQAQSMTIQRNIPLSGMLGFWARWGDDWVRDTASDSVLREVLWNRTVNRLPGDGHLPGWLPVVGGLPAGREALPAKLDNYGRPVKNETEGPLALLGLRAGSAPEPDFFARVLTAYGSGLGKPPKTVSYSGGTNPMRLTPDEQRLFNEKRGAYVREELAKALNERWSHLGEDTGEDEPTKRLLRQRAIQQAVVVAQQRAAADVWRTFGADDDAQRAEARRRIARDRDVQFADYTYGQ